MKFRSMAACVMMATVGVSPLAQAAPLSWTQVTHFRAGIAEAAGSASTPQAEYSFRAQSYIDFDGSRAGFVYVDSFSYSSGYQFVTCTGPEFANIVSMNQSTGTVTVNATIDPSNPSCYSVNYSSGPLTLKASGQPDGSEHVSESGVGTQQLSGATFKINFQSDGYGEIFTGSTGFYTGVFNGRAVSTRSTNRTQVK